MSIPDFYRGDTKKYKLIVRNKESQEPISVDGGVLTVSMKKKEKDNIFLLQEVVNAVEDNPNVPTGEILVTLSSEKTELLPTGPVFYDFEFVSSTGEVTTMLAGTVNIQYDITTPPVPVVP